MIAAAAPDPPLREEALRPYVEADVDDLTAAEGTLRAYRVQKGRRVDLVMYSLLPGELA